MDSEGAGHAYRSGARGTDGRQGGGFWSDIELQSYTVLLSNVAVGSIDQFTPGASHGKDYLLMTAINVIGLGIPVLREMRKRKGSHGDLPDSG